jgi:Cytochrome oxidase complex assembly protein 1
MVCQFCGLDLPNDSNYCRKCGRPLSPSSASSQSRPEKRILRWVVFLVLCIVVALATAGGTVTYRHFAQLHSSIVYRDAIAKAQNSPEITRVLGAPIRSRLVPWGRLYSRGDSGFAYLISIISGSKGAGMLDAEVTRDHGVWRYRRLHVTPFGAREPIDLVKAPAIDPVIQFAAIRNTLATLSSFEDFSVRPWPR